MRYASPNNFVGRDLYSPFDCAWLHREAAAALENVVAWLAERRPGCTPLVLDALRPQRVQQQLLDAPEGTGLEMYLAPPERGAIHSFGMALDLTLLDKTGRELDMGTPFDDITSGPTRRLRRTCWPVAKSPPSTSPTPTAARGNVARRLYGPEQRMVAFRLRRPGPCPR